MGNDFTLLLPEAFVTVLAVLVLVADFFAPSERKHWLGYASALGLIGILAFTLIFLWGKDTVLYNALQNRGSFVRHTHPFLDDITIRAQSAVTLDERTKLETETGMFMYDESIYASLYMWDAVWAVGPRLDDKSWSENLFYGDIRNVNGYEWIEPRQ